MINPQSEKLITLAAAARLIPKRRAGKNCSISTVYRWTLCGCRGAILESLQIGGTRCTSEEALSRFFQELSAATTKASVSVPPPTSTVRLKQAKRIDEQLDKLGLK